jgi:Bacterial RNA polymerase, alpha chain C terminal domain
MADERSSDQVRHEAGLEQHFSAIERQLAELGARIVSNLEASSSAANSLRETVRALAQDVEQLRGEQRSGSTASGSVDLLMRKPFELPRTRRNRRAHAREWIGSLQTMTPGTTAPSAAPSPVTSGGYSSAADAALAADLALPIEELNLTVRSYNCLKREGIHTVGELIARSEEDLLDIRNFRTTSIEEVKQKLTDMGLALKESPPGFDPGTAADSYGADDDDDYVETEEY